MEQTTCVSTRNVSPEVHPLHDSTEIVRRFSEQSDTLLDISLYLRQEGQPTGALAVLERLKKNVPHLQQLASDATDVMACKHIGQAVQQAFCKVTQSFRSPEMLADHPELVASALELASSLYDLHGQVCSKVLSCQL